MKRVIHIGDGRHIEIEEGALRLPPPEIKPEKVPYKRPINRLNPPKTGKYFGGPREKFHIPGYRDWLVLKHKQTKGLSGKVGRRYGQLPDTSREETKAAWAKAHEQVKKDMANIKQAGIELDAAGEEALKHTLEIMRGPGDMRLKLQAARQVLEWTKAKPAAKSEVTLNKAEEWLASLATSEDVEQD